MVLFVPLFALVMCVLSSDYSDTDISSCATYFTDTQSYATAMSYHSHEGDFILMCGKVITKLSNWLTVL